MNEVPAELKYTHSHEWVRDEGNGVYTVGLTDHAQSLLGDMVFFDLPSPDDEVDLGDDCAVAESVKAASDVYAPLSGQVLDVNTALENSPELVNHDPYGDGWLWRMRIVDESDLSELLDAEQYQSLLDDNDDNDD